MLCATLGGCVTVIGNSFDLGNEVSSGSLYNVKDGHSAMTLTLMALMAHYLDLRLDTKHCFPNNKWQIYTKGLLAWTVTDTVAYALLWLL